MTLTCATTRIAFKNVLVATDFSPVSDSALRFATATARRYSSKLWVTNVISPAETALVPPEYWGSSQQMIEEATTRQLQELGSKLRDVPHEVLLEHGGIAETISAEVEGFPAGAVPGSNIRTKGHCAAHRGVGIQGNSLRYASRPRISCGLHLMRSPWRRSLRHRLHS